VYSVRRRNENNWRITTLKQTTKKELNSEPAASGYGIKLIKITSSYKIQCIPASEREVHVSIGYQFIIDHNNN
jgi:hypothetical protein